MNTPLPQVSDLHPEIVVQDGQPVTTSLAIAKVFEKQHLHVLRTIRTLDVPKEFIESNFGLVDYTDAKGEKRPMYHITRDGFTILAMGFTGKKAMEFKIKYIEAFNRMEAELKDPARNSRALPEGPDGGGIRVIPGKLTREHQEIIGRILEGRSRPFPEGTREDVRETMVRRVCARFMVRHLHELADAFFPDVVAFLERIDLSGILPWRTAPRLDLNFPRSSARPARSWFGDYPDTTDGTLFIQDLLDPDYPDPLRQAIDRLDTAGYEVEGLRIQYQAMKGHLLSAAESFDRIYRLSRDRRMP